MLTTYYPNLQPYIVEQRVNGIRNGTVLIYNTNGKKINTIKYHNCQIHSISYYQNDNLHNLHGPAYMGFYNDKIYCIQFYQNSIGHNLHGPAFMHWSNGQINWISYQQNGIRHNLHGPAYIVWSNNGQIEYIKYYHFGKFIREFTFKI